MIEHPASLRLVEVFRSDRLAECDQQSLTLAAVGIHSWTIARDADFVILVMEDSRALAQQHLSESAREVLPTHESRPVPHSHPRAWLGSTIYAVVLVGMAYAAGRDLFEIDWLAAGALEGSVPHTDEWWRIITALTLHADVAHLIGNVVFGVILGFFAAQSIGAGIAWASIILGAAMGNALDALWMPDSQTSIGASTAVFATLGLLSAYAWRLQTATNLRWAKRWAPLIAGIILLSFTGAGGERTDIVAHLAGFASGCAIGAIHAKVRQAWFASRVLQLAAASLAIAAISIAWVAAILPR